MRERDVQSLVRLAVARIGTLTWRNNSAQAWVGRVVENGFGRTLCSGRRVVLDDARPLHAGLCSGSSDLIGFHTITITPEMIGRKVAVFTAIEVKSERGRVTVEQENFLRVVCEEGGIGIVARSVGDAVGGIKEWLARQTP